MTVKTEYWSLPVVASTAGQLATSAIAAGATVAAVLYDNNAALARYRYGVVGLRFTCDSTPAANQTLDVHLGYYNHLGEISDGYSCEPATPPDVIAPIRAVTSVQNGTFVNIPVAPLAFILYIKNRANVGVSAVSVRLALYNREIR